MLIESPGDIDKLAFKRVLFTAMPSCIMSKAPLTLRGTMPHHRASPLVPHLLTVRVTFIYTISYTAKTKIDILYISGKSNETKRGSYEHLPPVKYFRLREWIHVDALRVARHHRKKDGNGEIH
jgi:hypothetical protein